LLTFILAFTTSAVLPGAVRACGGGVRSSACAMAVWRGPPGLGPAEHLPGHAVPHCMVCHGELALARRRRASDAFYLAVERAARWAGIRRPGGAGVFTEFSEYSIGLAAACLLDSPLAAHRRLAGWKRATRVRFALTAAAGRVDGGAGHRGERQPDGAGELRDFYGILRVKEPATPMALRELVHGRVRHAGSTWGCGTRWPTAYYGA